MIKKLFTYLLVFLAGVYLYLNYSKKHPVQTNNTKKSDTVSEENIVIKENIKSTTNKDNEQPKDLNIKLTDNIINIKDFGFEKINMTLDKKLIGDYSFKTLKETKNAIQATIQINKIPVQDSIVTFKKDADKFTKISGELYYDYSLEKTEYNLNSLKSTIETQLIEDKKTIEEISFISDIWIKKPNKKLRNCANFIVKYKNLLNSVKNEKWCINPESNQIELKTSNLRH